MNLGSSNSNSFSLTWVFFQSCHLALILYSSRREGWTSFASSIQVVTCSSQPEKSGKVAVPVFQERFRGVGRRHCPEKCSPTEHRKPPTQEQTPLVTRGGHGRARGLTMGLLKAVSSVSMLTRRASARLPVRRCALLLWVWWPPAPPRRGSEPPLGTTSSSSESASWYLARRWAVERRTPSHAWWGGQA